MTFFVVLGYNTIINVYWYMYVVLNVHFIHVGSLEFFFLLYMNPNAKQYLEILPSCNYCMYISFTFCEIQSVSVYHMHFLT